MALVSPARAFVVNAAVASALNLSICVEVKTLICEEVSIVDWSAVIFSITLGDKALNTVEGIILIKSPLKNSILAAGIATIALLEILSACFEVSAGICSSVKLLNWIDVNAPICDDVSAPICSGNNLVILSLTSNATLSPAKLPRVLPEPTDNAPKWSISSVVNCADVKAPTCTEVSFENCSIGKLEIKSPFRLAIFNPTKLFAEIAPNCSAAKKPNCLEVNVAICVDVNAPIWSAVSTGSWSDVNVVNVKLTMAAGIIPVKASLGILGNTLVKLGIEAAFRTAK